MALRKGTRGIDTLVGTADSDLIVAYRGNDVLRGLAGADDIIAGLGNDSVDGGAGNDTIDGQGGADTLLGGDGNDFIVATEFGGGGPVTPAFAVDRIFGGAGFDFVSMDMTDIAYGGSGRDVVVINVPYGADTRWAVDLTNIGAATLQGIAAAGTPLGDCRVAEFEAASIYLINALGGSVLTGSAGSDSLGMERSFAASASAVFTIRAQGGDDRAVGSAGNDLIEGGAGNDNLQGGFQGNDTLRGGSGNDVIDGSGGADRLTGGTGVDQFLFQLGTTAPPAIAHITDFSRADDLLVIAADVGIFGNESNLLRTGATVTNGNTASGVGQLLYSTSTGRLAFDENGLDAGGVVTLLFLDNRISLSASDILIT